MLYLTGDTHGDWQRFQQDILPLAAAWGPDDTLLIAGDFGFLFHPEETVEEADFLRRMAALPFTVAFVDGNHECFPRLAACPLVRWQGGLAHQVRPGLYHLLRGECYTLSGLQVWCFGGGSSIDRMYRRPGLSWWPEELPNAAEYEKGRRVLAAHHHQVDIIITHAAPLRVMEQLGYHPGAELPLNRYLEEVAAATRFTRWYFGHLHVDRPFGDGLQGVYRGVWQGDTGERVDAHGE